MSARSPALSVVMIHHQAERFIDEAIVRTAGRRVRGSNDDD